MRFTDRRERARRRSGQRLIFVQNTVSLERQFVVVLGSPLACDGQRPSMHQASGLPQDRQASMHHIDIRKRQFELLTPLQQQRRRERQLLENPETLDVPVRELPAA